MRLQDKQKSRKEVKANKENASLKDSSAFLARSITWDNSKQMYYTARLMANKDLADDCYRGYAYLRWVDDFIDMSSESREERITFIKRQNELIDSLYKNELPKDLLPEERMIADLISQDLEMDIRLKSFINNFMAIIEFDAFRKGRLVSQEELSWYSNCVGKGVTDGLLYFIGNGHFHPATDNRYLAATAAHIVHMLRDMVVDTQDGFINIPREYLETHGISPEEMSSPPYRAWVQQQVELARQYFQEGKRYFNQLDVLRSKIVGYWYCVRFEIILDAIERDGYILRADYHERRQISSWLRIFWWGFSITVQHLTRKGRQK